MELFYALSKNDISQGVIEDIKLPEKVRFGITCDVKDIRFSIDKLSRVVNIPEDTIDQGK